MGYCSHVIDNSNLHRMCNYSFNFTYPKVSYKFACSRGKTLYEMNKQISQDAVGLVKDLVVLGDALHSADDMERAILVYKEALQVLENDKVESIEVINTTANILLQMCSAEIYLQRYTSAEGNIISCISLINTLKILNKSTSVNQNSRLSTAMTYQAAIYWLKNKKAKTLNILMEVTKLRHALASAHPSPESHSNCVEAWLNFTTVALESENTEYALNHVKFAAKCVDLEADQLTPLGYKYFVKLTSLISIAYVKNNDCYSAVKYSKLALLATVLTSKGMPTLETADALRKCGRLYVAIAKPHKALKSFNEAMAIYYSLSADTTENFRSETFQELSITYKFLGKVQESKEYAKASGKTISVDNRQLKISYH